MIRCRESGILVKKKIVKYREFYIVSVFRDPKNLSQQYWVWSNFWQSGMNRWNRWTLIVSSWSHRKHFRIVQGLDAEISVTRAKKAMILRKFIFDILYFLICDFLSPTRLFLYGWLSKRKSSEQKGDGPLRAPIRH